MEIKRTNRGFAYAEFEDYFSNKLRVQHSNISDAVWIGYGEHEYEQIRINRIQARQIASVLKRFADTGDLEHAIKRKQEAS